MELKQELKILSILIAIFAGLYFLPVGTKRFDNALFEALYLTKWYSQEHVIMCLIPALFIAGGISVFVSQNSVMKYLGGTAKKSVAYLVAALSGTILAVCSCTILPLFTGIYKRGAGLGPAIAFLYSGPAISVLSIILTANVLGAEMGIARAIGAITFSVVIGLIMEFIFKNDNKKIGTIKTIQGGEEKNIKVTILFFFFIMMILIFVNFAKPQTNEGIWFLLFSYKWIISGFFAVSFLTVLAMFYGYNKIIILLTAVLTIITGILFTHKEIAMVVFFTGITIASFVKTKNEDFDTENKAWIESTWDFTKKILPLLLTGVFVSGFLLGRVGHEGIIPSEFISSLVGGNSLFANFISSIIGAFMYFATLTEVPIIQGLMGSGMGKGPALALLLAGPALSLPSMIVIHGVLGMKKTAVFVSLVVVMSTITGFVYGML